jgi:hypothetical protein
MGAAARPLKHARDQNFFVAQHKAADRAHPLPVPEQTVHAAPDVHEPVPAAVQGRESRGTHQFAFFKFGGTNRAGLRIAGHAFAFGLVPAASARTPETHSPRGYAYAEKEGIAEPEQNDPYNGKHQNFK